MKDASAGVKCPISFERQHVSSHTNRVPSTRIVDDDIIHMLGWHMLVHVDSTN